MQYFTDNFEITWEGINVKGVGDTDRVWECSYGGNKIETLEDQVIKWNKIARNGEIPAEWQQELVVKEELQELMDAIKFTNPVEEFDALADVFFTGVYLEHCYPKNPLVKEYIDALHNASECYGLQIIIDCIKEVIKSNYTKFTPIEKGKAYAIAQRNYIEDKTGDFIRVIVTPEYYVYLNERNKVMKPEHYKEPDLVSIINKYNKKKES